MKAINSFFENDFKEIGYLVKQGSDGKLILPEKKIQEEWKPAIDDLVSLIKRKLSSDFLHSIYLRGSVAKGHAVKFISDIDFLILVNGNNANEEDVDIAQAAANQNSGGGIAPIEKEGNKIIHKKYPFIKYVEFGLCIADGIEDNKDLFLNMKIFTKHLYGTNVLGDTNEIFLKDVIVRDDFIYNAASMYSNNGCHKIACSVIMKLIMRQLFNLVAEKEGVYTRSLYYCYQYFLKNYPDAIDMAKKIVYLAINPSDDVEYVKSVINESIHWYMKNSNGENNEI